jgi:hypothetical protein
LDVRDSISILVVANMQVHRTLRQWAAAEAPASTGVPVRIR